jgi:hypothetical protein
VKPKKDELERLRELQSVEYDSEDDYLEKMFDEVVKLLSLRDSWGVGIKFTEGTHVRPYGPIYNKATATRLGQNYASILGKGVFVQQLYAPERLLQKEDT